VIKEFYQDPTTNDPTWVAIDVKPKKAMKKPITLSQIKKDKSLSGMQLIKLARLSVSAVTEFEFNRILELGETAL
jgi:predicted RNA-binding protein with PUA-like domain